MSHPTHSLAIHVAKPVVTALVVYGVASAIRLLAVEPAAIGLACSAQMQPAWCWPRELLVLSFHWHLFALASIGGALTGWILNRRSLLWIGIVAGSAGLALYNRDGAAPGLLLSALALVGVGNAERA